MCIWEKESILGEEKNWAKMLECVLWKNFLNMVKTKIPNDTYHRVPKHYLLEDEWGALAARERARKEHESDREFYTTKIQIFEFGDTKKNIFFTFNMRRIKVLPWKKSIVFVPQLMR